MDFALEWRDRAVVGPSYTPRQFLDYIVDGQSLWEKHGQDLVSCLGWFAPDEDERAAQRLVSGKPAEVEGRVAIYVCPEDGDVYCGAITTIIERKADEVVWRDIAHSNFDWLEDEWRHEPLTDLLELRFDEAQYRAAITDRPRPGA